MRLADLVKRACGLDYAVMSKAMARFGRRVFLDAALRTRLAAIQKQLST
jgi:hypothetical protein